MKGSRGSVALLIKAVLTAVGLAVGVSGCATIMKGSDQSVTSDRRH